MDDVDGCYPGVAVDYDQDTCSSGSSYPADWDLLTKLWVSRDIITADLRACDVMDQLRQDAALTQDDQETILHEVTTTKQTQTLVDVILRKDVQACQAFVAALRVIYPHLAGLIQDTGVTSRDRHTLLTFLASKQQHATEGEDCVDSCVIPTQDDVLSFMRRELQDVYKHQLAWLRPVPWNDAVMFSMADIYSDVTILDVTTRAVDEKVKVNITLDELFQGVEVPPRRILIEGEPGIGKSTLLNKMSLDWANEANHSWIRRFDQVLHFKVGCLSVSLVESIAKHLLSEDNVNIPTALLELKLLDSDVQQRTLLLVDGYDELQDKGLLHDIWSGKIMRKCTVIVTSRPASAPFLLKNIERKYLVKGFSDEVLCQYINKYAKQVELDTELFVNIKETFFPLADVRHNPLYLSLICLLLEDREGSLPDTKTELLETVLSLAKERTLAKLGSDVDDFDVQVEQLYPFAYTSLFNTRSIETLPNQCSSIFLKLGFIIQELGKSKLKPKPRFRFVHKLFQEYFAAKFLAYLPVAEIKEKLDGITDEDTKWNVCIFISGIISSDDEDKLLPFYKSIVCKNLAQPCHAADEIKEHQLTHLGMQCYTESGDFDGFQEIMPDVIPHVMKYVPNMCDHCIKGVASCQYIGPQHDLQINVGHQVHMHCESLGIQPDNNFCSLVFNGVYFIDDVSKQLRMILPIFPKLKMLYVYCGNLFPRRINFADSEQELREACELFHGQVQSIVFSGTNLRSCVEFVSLSQNIGMSAVLQFTNPCLRVIVLHKCTIPTDMASIVVDSLNTAVPCLRMFVFYDVYYHGNTIDDILKVLEHCTNLKRLQLSRCIQVEHVEAVTGQEEKTPDEQEAVVEIYSPTHSDVMISKWLPDGLFNVIHNNPITELILDHQEADWSLLPEALSDKSHILKYLDLSWTVWKSKTPLLNMDLSGLTTLKLQNVFGEDEIEILTGVLKSAHSLETLDISRNSIGHEKVFPSVCKGMSNLSGLKNLHLEFCDITDDSLQHLVAFENIQKVETLSLLGNSLLVAEHQAVFQALTVLTNLVNMMITVTDYTTVVRDQLVEAICTNLLQLRHLNITTKPSADVIKEFTAGGEPWPTRVKRLVPWLASASFSITIQPRPTAQTKEPGHWHWREQCLKYIHV